MWRRIFEKINGVSSRLVSWVVHPFLFAFFPVLSLYSSNLKETTPSMIFKPTVIILIGTVVFIFIANIIFRNWRKTAIFASLVVSIIFFHGHIRDLAGSLSYQIAGLSLDTNLLLFIIWFFVIVFASFLLFRARHSLEKFTVFLNFVATFLVLQSLVNAVPYEIGRLRESLKFNPGTEISAMANIGSKPDIYYIILDRYASNSTTKDFYEFDNGWFLNYLREKGFYVAEDSLSNYPGTVPSLSSSLSMDYLDPVEFTSKGITLLQNSRLGRFFKEQGYQYLHLSSWTGATKTDPLADKNFEFEGDSNYDFDSFSQELYQVSALAPIAEKVSPNVDSSLSGTESGHRDRVLYVLNELQKIPGEYPGPKFVFAHVLLPHDPYVFGPNCEEERPSGDTVDKYLSHVSCANKLMISVVNKILRGSIKPPVIVIQADEGPYNIKYPTLPGKNYREADPRSLMERARILNSYYLPGVTTDRILYPAITPVNSFRLILNTYFGTGLDLLPDRSYIFQEKSPFHDWKKPIIDFIDVTDLIINHN